MIFNFVLKKKIHTQSKSNDMNKNIFFENTLSRRRVGGGCCYLKSLSIETKIRKMYFFT